MATVAHASYLIKKKKGPDPLLVADQLNLLRWFHDTYGMEFFAKYFLWILAKREDARLASKKFHSRYVPFEFNPIQSDICKKLAQKNICLKPRQVGLTTFFLIIRCLVPTILNPGTNGFLISQKNEMASKHFRMLKRAFKLIGATDPSDKSANDFTEALHDNLLHTTASNSKEIILDQLDNFVGIGSAEVEEVGQGLTLHRVVCSEVARWPGKPEETLANLKEAIPMEGTIDLESTADGAQGYFFEEFMRAQESEKLPEGKKITDFRCHFHEWWWEPTYKLELTDRQEQELASDLSADEKRLMEKVKLTLQQVAFRRSKLVALRHNFPEKYPEDPLTCFLLAGKTFFDKDILRYRMLELTGWKPYGQTSNGELIILKKWTKGRRYVIGADPASGKTVTSEDTDYSAAYVIDLETGEQVASYQARLSPESFAVDLANLGQQYNNAIIAVERGTAADAGGEGGSVILSLIHDCHYTNIYKHREWLKREKKTKTTIELEGMPMNGKTRPIALNRLKWFIQNEPDKVHCIDFVKQALQFVRDERGRPAGAEGCHDDRVMAMAIACYARLVLLGYFTPESSKKERYGDTPLEEAEDEEVYDAED